MQVKRLEISLCQFPCHLDRMNLVDAVVVGAGNAVVGAVSQFACWQKKLNNCGDKID